MSGKTDISRVLTTRLTLARIAGVGHQRVSRRLTSARTAGVFPAGRMPPPVTLFYNAKMKLHTHDWPHVEKATRASHAYDHLKSLGLLRQVNVKQGRPATDAELRTVHTQRHIDEVRKMTERTAKDPSNRELSEPDGPGGVYYLSLIHI